MPRLFSFSRLSLVALLLAVLGSVAWAKPKVAVLGLEVINAGVVDPKDAQAASTLTDALRGIPRGGIGKFDFAPNSNRELQDEKLMGNCDTENPKCMAPIGATLGADYLVYGNIKKEKDGYKVTLKLLLVKPPKLEGAEDFNVSLATVAAGADPVKEWAQKSYAKLTGEKSAPTPRPESGPGKLAISSNARSGDVFIGASKKGVLEDGKLTLTLPEGSHELAIEAPGYRRYEATVTVKSGTSKPVDAQLEEVVGPVTPPGGGKSSQTALKVTGYGLIGFGALAGGYAAYLTFFGVIPEYARDGQIPFYTDGNRPPTATGDRCDESDLREENAFSMNANNANTAFDEVCRANGKRSIAVALGVASGVLGAGALFFAYRSESKASKENRSTAAGQRTRRQLTVTPVISPNGGGATVRFDW